MIRVRVPGLWLDLLLSHVQPSCRCCNILARFVTEAALLRLTASQDVPRQTFAAVQITGRWWEGARCRLRAMQSRLDQWPAAANPVTVTSIHQLVSPAREPSLGSILSSRKPRQQGWHIHVPTAVSISPASTRTVVIMQPLTSEQCLRVCQGCTSMLEHNMYMRHEPPLPAMWISHLHMSDLEPQPVNTCPEKRGNWKTYIGRDTLEDRLRTSADHSAWRWRLGVIPAGDLTTK